MNRKRLTAGRPNAGVLGAVKSPGGTFRADELSMKEAHVALEVDRAHQLSQLEIARLKQLVADLTLDKTMLLDVLAKILEARRETSLNHNNDRATQCRDVRRPGSRNATFTEGREKTALQ